MVVGFAGSPGPAGPPGTPGEASVQTAPTDAVQPESCATCHSEAGDKHQASYDELYQDGVITVTDLAYEYSSPDTHTVTFKMNKDGAPFDAKTAHLLMPTTQIQWVFTLHRIPVQLSSSSRPLKD
jgi:hypothetical protein